MFTLHNPFRSVQLLCFSDSFPIVRKCMLSNSSIEEHVECVQFFTTVNTLAQSYVFISGDTCLGVYLSSYMSDFFFGLFHVVLLHLLIWETVQM